MTAADTYSLRAEFAAAAREISRRGLSAGSSGNLSVRARSAAGREGFLITPSGIAFGRIEPQDLVWLPLSDPPSQDGSLGFMRPSSEWEMHARVYLARPDAGAVLHTHSCYATALACQEMPIPAFHYMVAAAGTDEIRVAPYALFGTTELAKAAADAMKKADACLLSHHGVLVCAGNAEGAVALAGIVEDLARQYIAVRSLGKPKLLGKKRMKAVMKRFRDYGQPRSGGSGER
jgi:L-fuculose-phosphate aldolase